jgi:hypothetical protein
VKDESKCSDDDEEGEQQFCTGRDDKEVCSKNSVESSKSFACDLVVTGM